MFECLEGAPVVLQHQVHGHEGRAPVKKNHEIYIYIFIPDIKIIMFICSTRYIGSQLELAIQSYRQGQPASAEYAVDEHLAALDEDCVDEIDGVKKVPE